MSALPGFTLAALLLNVSLAEANGLVLKKDLELKGSTVAGKEAPLFLTADRIDSTAVGIIEAAGRVEARQAGRNFFADWLRYDTRENSVQARGKVRLEQPALLVTGDSLDIDLDTYSGQLAAPVYRFVGQPGRGDAERIDFIDENNFSLADATYTTCSVEDEDWYLKIADLDIDRGRDVGTAHHASLRFLGVPILYTPWMSFPLGDARKSGILAPTIGTTERSGLDIVVPYYLNLAPNYDATLYPRLLSKRGVQLGGEFRYLLEDARGVNRVEYLDDSEAARTRWSVALNNSYRLNANTQAGMLFDRVSDDDYFRDLSNLISITSLSHLNREVWVTTQHAHWNAELRAQSFQTLQDSTASTPIAEPYARLPHARLGAAQTFGRFEFTLESEATRFAHPTKTEGTRVLAYPTLRMPLVNDYGFLTPQIGWHSTYYALDESAADDNIVRNLPIFSLDSGVVFDRPMRFSGVDFEQTLEPRVYYVYAPYRDQDDIPIFDTGLLDFSYAQMFTPNQFIGGDRINDANQLTVAVTSRFVEAESGLERLQVTLGQRYYFTPQRVTLPGVDPRSDNTTDLLAAVSGQITRDWRIDTAWQFDTQNGTVIRQNLGASYRPGPGRAINFGYRFIDQTTEQVDVSAQWPLGRRWYGMFRYNYSFQDDKLVEGLAGLEYNGGCWALRTVFQRLATKEDQSTDALFFQLELNGMGRLGSNPLDVLKQSVPGYRPSNEILPTP
ncbi:organic solvent tolerance transmembrane protein [Thiobacillus denitrificans ATCC 25259]|uniref:LPS-assembly protein LptD n=1 Tax=Thiobacillus denitrificans (strain ATCC 25259 / T1) TaxID=292415 RepID=LPTD_THIDA|nr:LPS-assembly protein LptD [Thiobacillus denitrificans]Q3SGG0.1 RecName: Full=LPS-assembly protein LptD; Flags: Precursor [Thiobacillus denitrificans ATCC 25259]AAZ98290.1 organic solvent tolerance transmembrane protein [Thiobacillus denitrificans ATCC 25259]